MLCNLIKKSQEKKPEIPLASLKYLLCIAERFAYGSWSLKSLNKVDKFPFSHAVFGMIICKTNTVRKDTPETFNNQECHI